MAKMFRQRTNAHIPVDMFLPYSGSLKDTLEGPRFSENAFNLTANNKPNSYGSHETVTLPSTSKALFEHGLANLPPSILPVKHYQSTSCSGSEEEENFPDLFSDKTGQTKEIDKNQPFGKIVSIAHFIKSRSALNGHMCPGSEDVNFVFKTERSVGLWCELILACHECHQVGAILTDPQSTRTIRRRLLSCEVPPSLAIGTAFG